MDKNSPLKWTFRTFECLGENSPNSSCQIWKWSDKSVWTLHLSSMSWEITLLYFFSWNFVWFLQKEPIKVQNLRLDWSGEISPNLYCFVMLLLLKVYKVSAKKVQRSYIYLMISQRVAQNLKKNRFVVWKMKRILIRARKSLKILPFDWSLSCKVHNV